jgi:hypothetical protein
MSRTYIKCLRIWILMEWMSINEVKREVEM